MSLSRLVRASLPRPRAIVVAICLCVVAVPAQVWAQNTLKHYKNYIITGDYVAAGVPLRGTGGSGLITISGVPAGADLVAAHLYWQTVLRLQDGIEAGMTGASFNGVPLTDTGPPFVSLAKPLNPNGTAPCWSNGGATGSSNGTHKSVTYRADVMNAFQNPDALGKLIINGAFPITLPDIGSVGNGTPATSGATLVLVWRHPDYPLRAIVINDGGFTLDNATPTMTQTLRGFYQPSASPSARMTHVVGDGQMNFSEQLLFNGVPLGGTNPFVGPAWDTVTAEIPDGQMPQNSQTATTSVTPVGSNYDCLSWSAIVLSTKVQDTDEDGLIDLWESSTTLLPDPNAGCPTTAVAAACFLPNLNAMGADPTKQDIFLEVGRMTTGGYEASWEPTPGAPEVRAVLAHDHLPSKAVLEQVATAFKNAPPRPLRGGGMISGPIRIHFDVGNNHQAGLPSAGQCAANWQASCSIIPAALARGGEAIDEAVGCHLVPGTIYINCDGLFPGYPGTVGWKSGFMLLRNQPLGYAAGGAGVPTPFVLTNGGPTLEEQCVAAGISCVRRFDRNRKDIFRYLLFAHALGLESATPGVPKNTSGIADGGGVGGGDLMVTLGLWDDYIGSPFIQASTILHELGHTMGLRHGGGPPVPFEIGGQTVPVAQPNCKPNYLSIMNYLFQVRGLFGASSVPTIDFSRQTLTTLDESNLTENLSGQAPWNAMAYKTSWFVPTDNQELLSVIGPVLRRCDGTVLPPGADLLVRVDGTTQNGLIDWNWDGDTADSGPPPKDINYNSLVNDGSVVTPPWDNTIQVGSPTLAGYNDFDHLDLRQTASRRNGGSSALGGGLSLDVGFGDVGFGDVGFGDVGFGDVGFGDVGFGDVGFGDVGFGDVGFGDVGFGDVGFGDVGFGDVGFGDVGFGDVGAPPGELDLDTAAGLNGPQGLTATALSNRIRLTWNPPHLGEVQSYTVYKVVGGVIGPDTDITTVGNITPTVPGNVTTVEDRDVRNRTTYLYFVVADVVLEDLTQTLTGPSNFVTITK